MSQGSSAEENVFGTEIGSEYLRSVLTVADLDALRGSCFILGEFQMVLTGPQGRVHAPPVGSIGVYEEALKVGLHFFLHPFVGRLLERFDLSLAQVTPNSRRYIIGFLVYVVCLVTAPPLVYSELVSA